jgi:hypothetical protein
MKKFMKEFDNSRPQVLFAFSELLLHQGAATAAAVAVKCGS